MIALRKGSRPSWLALGTPQLFFFAAQQKKALSELAQRAVWASSIITLINNCNQYDFQKVSLRKLIQELKINSRFYYFDQQNEKNIKEMFSKGIKLRTQFSSQHGIISGAGKWAKLFIFNPNYTVTQPIFSCLTDLKSSYFVTGGYGISKTVSFALYQHLSPHIHRFVFQTQRNRTFAQELVNLQEQYLLYRYPKCWYWQLSAESFTKPNSLKDFIIKQTIQLPETKREELKSAQSEQQLIGILQQYYENANIQRIAIIDQVNIAASAIRDWNNSVVRLKEQEEKLNDLSKEYKQTEKEYDERIKESTSQSEIQRLFKAKMAKLKVIQDEQQQKRGNLKNLQPQQSKYEKATSIIDQISRFSRFGVFQILASSINFERNILQKSRSAYILSLNFFDKHKEVKELQIEFSKSIKEQRGRMDFLDFFVFEIERRLPKSKRIYQLLEANKEYFLSSTSPDTLKEYYRIIFIRQYLDSKFGTIIQNKLRQYQRKTAKINIFSPQLKSLPDSLKNEQLSFGQVSQQSASYTQFIKTIDQAIKEILQLPKNEATSTSQKSNQLFKTENTLVLRQSTLSPLQLFDKFCYAKSLQKVERYLKDDKQRKKLSILQTLYHIARVSSQFGYHSLSFSTKVYSQTLGCNAEQFFLDNYHNKQLLPVKYHDDTITFHWTPQQFIMLTKDFVEPELSNFYMPFINGYARKFLKRSKSTEGHLFQFAVTQILNPKVTIQFAFFDKQKSKAPRIFTIGQKDSFLSFLAANPEKKQQNPKKKGTSKEKKSSSRENNSQQEQKAANSEIKVPKKDCQQQSLIENFSSVLKLAKENNCKAVAAEPFTMKDNQLVYVSNSPVIDFAFVQCNKNGQFEIFTFDVATSDRQEAIKDKRNKALAFFRRLTKDPLFKKEQPILKHVILCKQRLCLAEEIHPSFSIAYSPYEAINVVDYPQARLHEYLFFMIYRISMDNKNMRLSDLTFRDKKLEQVKRKKQ